MELKGETPERWKPGVTKYEFKTLPLDHQREALKRGWSARAFAYLMDMGTGKTKTCLDNTGILYERDEIDAALIVAPKSVYRNWIKEIALHVPDRLRPRVAYWDANLRRKERDALNEMMEGRPIGTLDFLLVNIEALITKRAGLLCRDFLKSRRALMAVDESINIKNESAGRTKAALALGEMAAYRRILTGSPITEGPMEFYSQFRFLDPTILGFESYYTFRNHFAETEEHYYHGRSRRPVKVVVGYKNLDELVSKVARHSFRVRKQDCLDLPEKVYQTRTFTLPPKDRAVYNSIRDDAMAVLQSGEVVEADLVITALMRLRQVASGFAVTDDGSVADLSDVRLRALLEVIEESAGKVVIWAPFRHSVESIASALARLYGEKSVARFYGGVKAEERVSINARFQNGADLRFIVANRAGAYGLDFTAAQLAVYYANDWDLDSRVQSEDRIHRFGQKGDSCLYVDLVAEGTVDETILAGLKAKKDLSLSLTDPIAVLGKRLGVA